MEQFTLGNLIGSGAAGDVYEYGEGRVCKLYKAGAGSADYEYQKIKRLYEAGIPVPRPYEFIKTKERYGFVMERIKGESFMESLLKKLHKSSEKNSPYNELFYSELLQEQIKLTARMLAELHSIKCSFEDTVKTSLQLSCHYSSYLSDKEKDTVKQLIESLPDGESICHGDPNPGNFIKFENTIRIIDWNNSAKGSFLYDISEYFLTMRYADLSLDWDEYEFEFMREYQNEFSKVFAEEYIKSSGKALNGLEAWTLPVLISKAYGNNPPKKQKRLLEDMRKCLDSL